MKTAVLTLSFRAPMDLAHAEAQVQVGVSIALEPGEIHLPFDQVKLLHLQQLWEKVQSEFFQQQAEAKQAAAKQSEARQLAAKNAQDTGTN